MRDSKGRFSKNKRNSLKKRTYVEMRNGLVNKLERERIENEGGKLILGLLVVVTIIGVIV